MEAAFLFFGIVFVIVILFGRGNSRSDVIENMRKAEHDRIDKHFNDLM
jgi:hypothetical protein